MSTLKAYHVRKQGVQVYKVLNRPCLTSRYTVQAQCGFSLIELIVVILILAILSMAAFASYQRFVQKKDMAIAQQEIQNIAAELEKFKAKNFSYKGFDASAIYGTAYEASTGSIPLPVNASISDYTYMVTVLDFESGAPLTTLNDTSGEETSTSESVLGLNWVIQATRRQDEVVAIQAHNYDFLLTSTGLRCKSKTNNAFADFNATSQTKCSDIDTNSELW